MVAARTAAEELALAKQHDAAGEHSQAVNSLARATSLGDVDATTELGQRLLAGDRAPLLPRDGVGFLLDAYKRGGADAAARLAVLAGLGVYLEPSLDNAFGLLTQAAERGSITAREQLRLLGTDRELAERADPLPRDYWQKLAESIDSNDWLSAVPARVLSDSPSVRAFASLLPKRICAWLIARSADRLERALVYDPVGGRDIADHTRTNTVAQFNLATVELVQVLMQMRMAASCGLPLVNMESAGVLHYDVGEQITNHFDFVNPKTPNYEAEIARNGQRILTFLIYLNEDYDGGETEFPKLGISHKGTCGEGLCFINALPDGAPDLRTVHAGRPPVRGEKWIVTVFGRNRRVLAIDAPSA